VPNGSIDSDWKRPAKSGRERLWVLLFWMTLDDPVMDEENANSGACVTGSIFFPENSCNCQCHSMVLGAHASKSCIPNMTRILFRSSSHNILWARTTGCMARPKQDLECRVIRDFQSPWTNFLLYNKSSSNWLGAWVHSNSTKSHN
jgi:hypothetical protein